MNEHSTTIDQLPVIELSDITPDDKLIIQDNSDSLSTKSVTIESLKYIFNPYGFDTELPLKFSIISDKKVIGINYDNTLKLLEDKLSINTEIIPTRDEIMDLIKVDNSTIVIEDGFIKVGKINKDKVNGLSNDLDNLNNNKLDKNSPIVGSTKCKITYDNNGLVVEGSDLEADDIPSLSTDKINSLTNYTKGSSTEALDTSDTLNQALGKLENRIDATDKLFETDKDLGDISISNITWNVYDSLTQVDPTDVISGEFNLSIEKGYYVELSCDWKWNATSDQKDATSCSGDFGTVLPEKNTNKSYYGDRINSSKTYTQTIFAPKSGLMVSGTKVVKATGNDSRSGRVSVTFKDKYYIGYSTTKDITESIIKSLSTTNLTTTRVLTKSVVTQLDQYVVYAYPNTLGNLTRITMDGATPVLGAFTKLNNITITNEAGLSVEMLVYVSNNPGAFTTSASLKFE